MTFNSDKGYSIYEDKVVDGTSIEKVNREVLADYKKLINAENLEDEIVLEFDGFMRDGKLTVAGVLIFGQKVAYEFPQSKLQFIRYNGIKTDIKSRFDEIISMEFTGPLPFLIQEGYRSIKFQLCEHEKYPEYLWARGIINALIHRDYSLTNDCVRVVMYDDQLEIFSPGGLTDGVSLENMRYTKLSRNPRLTKTIKRLGLIRESNEGINKKIDTGKQMISEYTEPYGSAVVLRLANNSLR
ncbi:hypothetical protein HYO62_09190 [Aerococcaceae bacterium DSM 111022]|nr:hypothetical protein [Aerococcaceae bacterium DSM 111022]